MASLDEFDEMQKSREALEAINVNLERIAGALEMENLERIGKAIEKFLNGALEKTGILPET